ncbi:MAG: PKD domain-containing protein [Bacteroidetes bacterium]|nr:PKD domain-containing protein [Bacteroidota bacterium]
MRKYILNILLNFFIVVIGHSAVVATFTSNVSSGCASLTVNFQDLSTGNPTSWTWSFGNGNTSTLQNASAIYNTPGVYSVTLTVSDGTTTDTEIKTITVHSNPVANFSTVPQVPCSGKSVLFTDNSTLGSAAITTWLWDYGDGNSQTIATNTSTHTYTSGTYPVTLIVTDANGCTGSVIKTTTVVPAPTANFTGSPASSCTAPLTTNFSSTSTINGTATYAWTFGDGGTSTAQNPAHTYVANGSYTVKLVVNQGGCIDSVVKTNFVVVNKIAANFSVPSQTVCVGQSVNFTDASLPLASTAGWQFGDGSTSTSLNPSYAYNAAGVYSVTFVATDASGCSDTIVKPNFITVNANPVASFTATSTQGCSKPHSVNFTDASTGAVAWQWDFGDGGGTSTQQNPVYSYTAEGSFNVSLIVTNANGCTASSSISSLVNISVPVINFSATPLLGCIPLPVTFTSSSTSTAVPITSYAWTFGDGNTQTTAATTATNTYNTQGFFTVKLVVTTATGCKDSLVQNSYVKAGTKPVADFSVTPTTVCFGFPVQFADLTNIADEWQWSFGDGGSSTIKNPLYVYGDTGTFDVRLVALNNGCADTIDYLNLMTVNPPKPNFTYTLSCTNYYNVNFTNTSAAATSVQWDFGDGTFDLTNNNTPTHTYAARGLYTVSITATNTVTGCTFSRTQSFTIAEPIADFTYGPNPAKGCVPLNVTFNSAASQDASTYLWDFGSTAVASSNQASPTASYTAKGLFSPTLTITDVNGCTSVKALSNIINAYGITQANYVASPTSGCAPLGVTFKDLSLADSLIINRIWNFGDGNIDTTSIDSIFHVYPTRGAYTVTLTVQDANGCFLPEIKLSYINATKPYPALVVDTFRCKNDVITFDASTSSVATPATYAWNFGDGSVFSSTLATTTHSYTVDNVYTATLTITDVNGCDSSITHTIRILKPTAGYRDSILSYGCGTMQVQFTDTSKGFVNGWQWNFGNGATSTLKNPSYTYTSPGSYSITLIVTNVGGCTDTIVKNNIVVPGPVGSFSFTPSIGCVPFTVTFNATSNNADYYTWDFGDGTLLSQTNQSTVVHTYSNNISVTPILLIGDPLPNGNPCELPANNLTGSVIAATLFDVQVTPPSPVSITEDQMVQLNTVITGTVVGNLSYAWTSTGNISCTNCSDPIITSNGQGAMYIVTVTDLGSGGCYASDTATVVFVPCESLEVEVPNVFSPNYDGVNDIFNVANICKSYDYLFTVYDRWGVEMFSTNLRKNGWDGRTTAGEPVPDGTYYYTIKAADKNLKGFIQVIR